MSPPLSLAVLGLALATGCAGDSSPLDDTANVGADRDCASPLALGRCGVAGTEADCTGNAGEERVFVDLDEGDPVGIVTGFQGATMFAFAIQAQGIDPGQIGAPANQGHPLVEVTVHRTSYSVVGRFRNWIPFAPIDDDPNRFEVTELYVLLGAEVPVEAGQELWAEATLEDANGVTQCGSVSFVSDR